MSAAARNLECAAEGRIALSTGRVPYLCLLKLEGYLTFSSSATPVVVGRDLTVTEYRPAPVIHNIALTYALAGLPHGSLGSRVNPPPWKTRTEPPLYMVASELKERFYVYPAKPIRVVLERQLAIAGGEKLVSLQAQFKSMYPWRVLHQYYAPGSEFLTTVLAGQQWRPPRVVRLGAKRYGVARVECREAEASQAGPGFSDPVNLNDILSWGLKPRRVIVLLDHKNTTAGRIVRAELDSLYEVKARMGGHTYSMLLPLPPGVGH
jgi:CRISPR type I-D-associated protein Csc1